MDEIMAKFNPDWEYILWDEESIKNLDIKDFNVYLKPLILQK